MSLDNGIPSSNSDLFEWLKVNANNEMYPDKVYVKFLDFFGKQFGVEDKENGTGTTKEKINYQLTKKSIKDIQKECNNIRKTKNKRKKFKFIPNDKNGNKIKKKPAKQFYMENDYKLFTDKDRQNPKYFVNNKFHLGKYKNVKFNEFKIKHKNKYEKYIKKSQELEDIYNNEYKKQSKPKRAPNEFVLYSQSEYATKKFNKIYPNPTKEQLSIGGKSKLYSELWRNESKKIKEKYKKQSLELRSQRNNAIKDWDTKYIIKQKENIKLKKINIIDDINKLIKTNNLQNEEEEELTEDRKNELIHLKQKMFEEITLILRKSLPTSEELIQNVFI